MSNESDPGPLPGTLHPQNTGPDISHRPMRSARDVLVKEYPSAKAIKLVTPKFTISIYMNDGECNVIGYGEHGDLEYRVVLGESSNPYGDR